MTIRPDSIDDGQPVDFDPFAAGPLFRVVPTTEAQREVWLADGLGREASLAFNEAIRIAFDGALDVPALRTAIAALVARHESLRSTITPDGMSMLVAERLDVPLRNVDLSVLPETERDAGLQAELDAAVRTPFDLAAGPLLRAALLVLDGDRHELVLSAHHVVCDGWSFGVLVDDLASLYDAARGLSAGPAAASDTFGDYAARDAARRDSADARDDERFWLDRFALPAPVLDLPTDRPRPAVRGFASRRLDRPLDAALVGELKRLGGRHGASLFGVLAGVFAATLARIGGQHEVVLGLPAAGQSASGMIGLVGHCVNLLPVRLETPPERSGAALLASTRSALLDAFEHQEYTFGTLLRRLHVARDPARLPLVSVMFNLDRRIEGATGGFTGLGVRVASVPRCCENFELFVNATQVGDSILLECQYATGLFDEGTVQAWLSAYEAMLRGIVAAPDAAIGTLSMLDASQRNALALHNATATPFDADDPVHARIARQAASTPDAVALVAGHARATHAELRVRVRRIAAALRARGAGPGDRVGLCVERQVDLVAALLGVLECGAAYVPLDPGFPPDRLAYMARDAELALLVAEAATAHRIEWPEADRLLLDDATIESIALGPDAGPAPVHGESAAYVIYTSGSTGRPKGVEIPHRAVANFLAAMAREPGMRAGDRLLAVTTLSFDIAVLELLLPLTLGASVVIASREETLDGAALRRRIDAHGVTVMQATPGTWRMLIEAGWHGDAAFRALVGGEALPVDLARALLDRCGEVWNMYGPTETTVWSTVWRVAAPERGIAIGRPIDNTQVHVLDEDGAPCAVGVPGELWIGGDGVATGYWRRPELTAERFVEGGLGRLYRTGDRGRWRADGQLEHLGRLDAQVKLRGFRIELGEIESTLRTHPAVADAIALVRTDRPGDSRLVAYWSPRSAPDTASADAGALAAHLERTLPEYMLPQHFVALPAIPRLPNGKFDRGVLPAPGDVAGADAAERAEPRTELERIVLAAMERALGVPGLGVRDDFFLAGGHSLLAASVIGALNRHLGASLSMRTLFEAPTAERLAARIEREAGAAAPGAQRIARRTDRATAPLSLNQERMWFLEQLQPGRTVYNTPSAHRLRGRLDAAALGRAFQAMVDRHEVLRTAIESDAHGTRQRIHARLDVSRIPLEDLSATADAQREATLAARIAERVETPFDLGTAPLFVLRLYRLAPEEHVLLFMPHHAIWDGWSFDLFYDEIAAFYVEALDGTPAELPALDVSYGDFAAWQREWLESPEFARQATHWQERFAAATAVPRRPLMTDLPRSATMSGEGRTEWTHASRPTVERLRELGRDHDATLFMTLLSAWSVLLAGLGAVGRQVIGVPVRGRNVPETEPLMGYFTNLLPVIVDVAPEDAFIDLQTRVRHALLDAFTFPDVPLERLIDDMPQLRGAGPLYHALFSFQDARRRPGNWGNLRHERLEIAQRGATEDLGLWLVEQPRGLAGGLTYHTGLYRPHTAAVLRQRYERLLERIVADPRATVGELLALDADDAERLQRWTADDDGPRREAAQDGPPALASATRTPPATPTEKQAAGIWARLLALDAVCREDNFFDLGGHSLLLMQAVNALEQATGRRIDARRYVFESLAQIAAACDAAPPIPRGPRGLIDRLLGARRSTPGVNR